jgi:hypothetical protein
MDARFLKDGDGSGGELLAAHARLLVDADFFEGCVLD